MIDIKPRLKGRAVLIRDADDAVLGFSQEEDARRVLAVLPKRFGSKVAHLEENIGAAQIELSPDQVQQTGRRDMTGVDTAHPGVSVMNDLLG